MNKLLGSQTRTRAERSVPFFGQPGGDCGSRVRSRPLPSLPRTAFRTWGSKDRWEEGWTPLVKENVDYEPVACQAGYSVAKASSTSEEPVYASIEDGEAPEGSGEQNVHEHDGDVHRKVEGSEDGDCCVLLEKLRDREDDPCPQVRSTAGKGIPDVERASGGQIQREAGRSSPVSPEGVPPWQSRFLAGKMVGESRYRFLDASITKTSSSPSVRVRDLLQEAVEKLSQNAGNKALTSCVVVDEREKVSGCEKLVRVRNLEQSGTPGYNTKSALTWKSRYFPSKSKRYCYSLNKPRKDRLNNQTGTYTGRFTHKSGRNCPSADREKSCSPFRGNMEGPPVRYVKYFHHKRTSAFSLRYPHTIINFGDQKDTAVGLKETGSLYSSSVGADEHEYEQFEPRPVNVKEAQHNHPKTASRSPSRHDSRPSLTDLDTEPGFKGVERRRGRPRAWDLCCTSNTRKAGSACVLLLAVVVLTSLSCVLHWPTSGHGDDDNLSPARPPSHQWKAFSVGQLQLKSSPGNARVGTDLTLVCWVKVERVWNDKGKVAADLSSREKGIVTEDSGGTTAEVYSTNEQADNISTAVKTIFRFSTRASPPTLSLAIERKLGGGSYDVLAQETSALNIFRAAPVSRNEEVHSSAQNDEIKLVHSLKNLTCGESGIYSCRLTLQNVSSRTVRALQKTNDHFQGKHSSPGDSKQAENPRNKKRLWTTTTIHHDGRSSLSNLRHHELGVLSKETRPPASRLKTVRSDDGRPLPVSVKQPNRGLTRSTLGKPALYLQTSDVEQSAKSVFQPQTMSPPASSAGSNDRHVSLTNTPQRVSSVNTEQRASPINSDQWDSTFSAGAINLDWRLPPVNTAQTASSLNLHQHELPVNSEHQATQTKTDHPQQSMSPERNRQAVTVPSSVKQISQPLDNGDRVIDLSNISSQTQHLTQEAPGTWPSEEIQTRSVNTSVQVNVPQSQNVSKPEEVVKKPTPQELPHRLSSKQTLPKLLPVPDIPLSTVRGRTLATASASPDLVEKLIDSKTFMLQVQGC